MTPEQQHPRSRRFGTSYPVSRSTEYDRGVDASSHRRRLDERRDIGIEWRRRVPLDAHAQWAPPENRTDPVETLIAQGKQRIPELLPERYARMRVDPFAFLRGAAAIMAADLAVGPSTGLRVQACGDCHLANFGTDALPDALRNYPRRIADASPERRPRATANSWRIWRDWHRLTPGVCASNSNLSWLTSMPRSSAVN